MGVGVRWRRRRRGGGGGSQVHVVWHKVRPGPYSSFSFFVIGFGFEHVATVYLLVTWLKLVSAWGAYAIMRIGNLLETSVLGDLSFGWRPL